MKKILFLFAFALILLASPTFFAHAQFSQGRTAQTQIDKTDELLGQDIKYRIIQTAVPFLSISPDARAAGMGDVGAATSPDANSQHWNAAKYAFAKKSWGVGLSYTPWLKRLIDDMNIYYLTGYKKFGKYEAVALSLRYFDLGDVQLTDDQSNSLGTFSPREWSIDASYSRKLSEHLSIAGTGRFILSNLIGNIGSSATQARAGVSGAVDIGIYGTKDLSLKAKNANFSYGLVFSNIGRKLTYSGNEQREFIPMNMRLGGAFTTELDMYNKFTFALDLNKLMVPTTQVDSAKQVAARDKTMLSGMFSSFGDAPDGLKEELREVMLSFGAEYWYKDMFSGRVGYFHENKYKGNRKYFTFGLGLRYNWFGLDVAYMVPQQQNNPLGETIRFTLIISPNSSSVPDNFNQQ